VVAGVLALLIGLLLFLVFKFGLEFAKVLLAPLVGALLGFLVMLGLIWSQTQPPDTNPANQPILSYGA
jgi:hypothetical protein